MNYRTLPSAVLSLAAAAALSCLPTPALAAQSAVWSAPPALLLAALASLPPSTRGGYLGVDIRDVPDEQIAVLKVKDNHGAEILRVDHDGPAGKAGLHEHDVILQMNGLAIDTSEQLRRLLRATSSGQNVSFLISRDGQTQNVSAQLANREDVERRAWEQHIIILDAPAVIVSNPQAASPAPPSAAISPGFAPRAGNSFLSPGHSGSLYTTDRNLLGSIVLRSAYTGAILETMSPQLAQFFGTPAGSGLLVRSVDSNSPAATAGLHAGDVVLRVNAAPVNSTSDWLKAIHENKGKTISIVVLRDKHEQTLALTPDPHKRSSLEPIFPESQIDPAQINALVASIQSEVRDQTRDLASRQDFTELQDKVRTQLNSPEFKQQMEDLRNQINSETRKLDSEAIKQQLDAARTQLNSPEFKQQMEDLRSKLSTEQFKLDTEAMKQQLDAARTQLNSPEFKKQMEDLRNQVNSEALKLDSEAIKKQLDATRNQLNSPEFKKQMEDLRNQIDRLTHQPLSN